MARSKYTFEDSVVEADLKYWGFWKGIQCAADGYPPGQTIKELLSGKTEKPGHRVLCKDMPARAWQINAVVMRMPTDLIAALIGRYCLPMKDNGQPFESREIAETLGVPVRTFYFRLGLARRLYRRSLFGAELTVLTTERASA